MKIDHINLLTNVIVEFNLYVSLKGKYIFYWVGKKDKKYSLQIACPHFIHFAFENIKYVQVYSTGYKFRNVSFCICNY